MKFRTVYNYFKFKLLEKRKEGGRYLFFKSTNPYSLMIVFQAFPPTDKPIYNYVNGFSSLNMDRLYIGDYWGYKGSYYLYENGSDKPYKTTCNIIKKIIDKGNYKHIYTAGSSKGGTSAIIFGLKFRVDQIFAGACQYHIGSYLLKANKNILYAMMSKDDKDLNEYVAKLDAVMPRLILQSDKTSKIHILYSKKDPTYEEHIVDLLKILKGNEYCVCEKEEFFENHNDVGNPFKDYVVSVLK